MSKNDFEFKYSAPTSIERREIESIRNSYVEQGEMTIQLQQLRKLDSRVKNTPVVVSLVLGICGMLIFGLGMTCVLEWGLALLGVLIGAVGLFPMLFAYPVYTRLYNKLKAKYGKQIIELSDALLGDEQAKENNNDNVNEE